MGKPEDELFKHVKARLDYFKLHKIVLHYDDLRRLNLIRTRRGFFSHKPKGTPDIAVYIKHHTTGYIYFIELKTPNDKHRPEQLEYMLKFRDLTNVWYDVIRTADEVNRRIEMITGYSQSIFDSMPKEL